VSVKQTDLRKIPLFSDISDAHLSELLASLSRASFAKGHVLFREGDVPDKFLLLVKGDVSLSESNAQRFLLHPVAPIGELGSLTGIPRSSTAIAETAVEVLSIDVDKLREFFERRAEIAFPFYKNLLAVVSEKVLRDRRRLEEIRGNVIRTQKSMKKLREIVLEAPETPISKPVCDKLDELIEQNRRAHYRVSPVPALPAHLRLDDKSEVRIVDLSDAYLKLEGPKDKVAPKGDLVAVLVLPSREILVSGKVQRTGKDGLVVKLDVLIDEYHAALEDYVTRLQMLDYVV
jgi:CRP/FNR family transcriptional regulator, cyclic AMP receptor protein